MIIAVTVFIISIQSVNASENKLNILGQKFNLFFDSLKNQIVEEIEDTKEFQAREWKEAKNQKDKTLKIVNQKLTGFFSDFPNTKGDK